MNTTKENNLYGFQFSFLDNKKKKTFLKKGMDLGSEFWTQPLDELICLNRSDLNLGVLFDKKRVPRITENIFNRFLSQIKQNQEKKISIKNNKILLFAYTLCKLDDIVLFLVWQITTKKSSVERTSWEDCNKLRPLYCCQKNYANVILKDVRDKDNKSGNPKKSDMRLLIDAINVLILESENRKFLIEKNCKYNKSHIVCNPIVFPHFFNTENQEAMQYYKSSCFNIPINNNYKSEWSFDDPLFHYGGIKNPTLLTCDLLYDSLIFEITSEKIQEHNFKKFISDSLSSCFYYQKNIQNLTYPVKKVEQKLLFVSIYM